MSATSRQRWWWGLILLGLALRVAVWASKAGFQYPDEIFQQQEPGQFLRSGLAWLPWEFDRGLRPWVFPWLYAGLLEIAHWLGLEGLAASRMVNLHNALWSAAMIPAGWKAGAALVRQPGQLKDHAALLGGLLMACWPMILYFSPHSLMGTPSMIFLAWGWAWWLEARQDPGHSRAALWMGLFFGLAGMARFTSGLHMLVPLADLLLQRRGRQLAWLTLGSLPGIALLGAVDWATWGRPFHSAIEHISYNYIEDGASNHGVNPWDMYLRQSLGHRLHVGLPVALFFLGLSLRRAWPLLLTAALPVALLSTIAHKEERFIMYTWPLLMPALALGAAQAWAWLAARRSARAATALIAAAVLLLLGADLYGALELPWRWKGGVFAAQEAARRRPDLTGLLFRERQHLSGGYTVLDRAVPLMAYQRALSQQPAFNYVAIPSTDSEAARLQKQGWTVEGRFEEGYLLLRKPQPAR